MSMKRKVAELLLRRGGWQIVDESEGIRKAVVVAAPHTSNWDGYHVILLGSALRAKFAWIGKRSLFVGPLQGVMRRLNGLPIDRRGGRDMVSSVAAEFQARDELLLCIAPEGTRSRAEFWKSGFYHIARRARVPILMGFIDYAQRRCGLGPAVHPSGDIRRDMETIRAFYRDMEGRYPENWGPIRTRDELG
ncbi:MAG: 1-acyl-sn-glycerol-3-phosphate acyltransferase [Myxococcota bacterium]